MLEDVVFTPEFLKKKGRALARTAPGVLLARPEGIEPPTFRLAGGCSVTPRTGKLFPLSYGRTVLPAPN